MQLSITNKEVRINFLFQLQIITEFCVKIYNVKRKIKVIIYLLGLVLSLSSQDSKWIIEKLPETINSGYDEIGPVPSRDGRKLYFTRVGYPQYNRTLILDSIDYSKKLDEIQYSEILSNLYKQLGEKKNKLPYTSPFNQDIWIGINDSTGQYNDVQHPDYPLNNALTNSLVALTPDPNSFYIINQFPPNGGMNKGFSVIKQKPDGTWNSPKAVTINDYYTLKSDVNLTMSFDGTVLILSAERFDSRDLDLYICFKESEDNWSAPKHLGFNINSSKREMTPYLSENNTTLFFASDRGNGYGGLDIYMTRREENNWFKWSSPILLVNPINSISDESQPYFNMTTGYLYFTSKRDGSNDIYRTQIAPPQPTEIAIKGRIINKQTNELITDAKIEYAIMGSSSNSLQNSDGVFSIKIPKGTQITLKAIKNKFNGVVDTLFFRHDYYYFKPYYTIDLLLEPLEIGGKIKVNPIYFVQSKSSILDDSYSELIYLYNILKENPSMEIQIEGHTDNVGDLEDLIKLSFDRAEAIKSYLVDHGIDNNRITTKGYGAGLPLTNNRDESERSKNRRVEIIVKQL